MECGILVAKAREMGINVPILGGDTWEAEEFLNQVTAYQDIFFSTHFTAEEPVTQVSTVFLEAFADKYPQRG